MTKKKKNSKKADLSTSAFILVNKCSEDNLLTKSQTTTPYHTPTKF